MSNIVEQNNPENQSVDIEKYHNGITEMTEKIISENLEESFSIDISKEKFEYNRKLQNENSDEYIIKENLSDYDIKGTGNSEKSEFLQEEECFLNFEEEITLEEEIKPSPPSPPQYDYSQLLENYRYVLHKEKKLAKTNFQLQKKLLTQFKMQKIDDFIPISTELDISELYEKILGEIEELWEPKQDKHMIEENVLTSVLISKQNEVNTFTKDFVNLKRQVALNAVNSQTNQKIPLEIINIYLEREAARDEEIRKARLKNIKETWHLQNLQHDFQKREEESPKDTINYREYKQLRIAMHTNHMQLEKQAQDFIRMDNIYLDFMQLLTHAKEKYAVLEPEVEKDNQYFKELSDDILEKTELLAELKLKKKASLHKLEMLKRHFGILGNKRFMRYYDMMQRKEHSIRVQITELKNKYQDDHTLLIKMRNDKKH